MTTTEKIENAKNEILEKLKGFSKFEVKETLSSIKRELNLRLLVN